jgi:hypothetical protein
VAVKTAQEMGEGAALGQCGRNSTRTTPKSEHPPYSVGTTMSTYKTIIMIHACRTMRRARPRREQQKAGRRL